MKPVYPALTPLKGPHPAAAQLAGTLLYSATPLFLYFGCGVSLRQCLLHEELPREVELWYAEGNHALMQEDIYPFALQECALQYKI